MLDELVARIKAIDLQEVQRVHESSKELWLITSDFLYVDLAVMKDLRLGAAMALRIDELDQRLTPALLQERMTPYGARDFYDVPHYFPELGVSNAAIDQALADPALADRIFYMAFPTGFNEVLTKQLLINANHSAVADKHMLDAKGRKVHVPIRVTINTHPLQLSRPAQDVLGNYVVRRYGVEAEVVCRPIAEWSLDALLHHEEFYLHHWKELFDRDDIHAAFLEGRMLKHRLFASRFFGYQVIPNHATEREAALTAATLDVMTQFKYIPADRLTPVFAAPTA